MSTLQLKRGATAAVAAYTPAAGEVVIDTTTWRIVIGDGSTIGGKPLTLKTGTSGDNVPLLSGANNWSGAQVFTASNTTFRAASGGTGLEIGGVTSAQSAYLDFHTSGNNIDYDSRILASGGSTTAGNGTLTVTAASFTVNGVIVSTGVTDASSAATGKVGEYLTSTASSVTVSTTNTATNIVSLTLSAGDWDVTGNLQFVNSSASITTARCGISSTTASLAGFPYEAVYNTTFTASATNALPVPTRRISVSASTTVYLVGYFTFSSGSATAAGFIRARRIR